MESSSSKTAPHPEHHPLLDIGERAFLFDLLPMAAYAVRAPDGVIVWFNKRATTLWGRTPRLGDTEERFCGAHKLYFPDGSYMAHCHTPVALVMNTGGSVHDDEVIIERPDKSRVTVSVHIDAVRDNTGEIVGVVNFFEDISERKAREIEHEVLFGEIHAQAERLQRAHEDLEQRVEERTASLRRLSSHLLHLQDDERRRISRELHDTVGQQLAAAKMCLARLEKLLPSEELLQRDSRELRSNLEDALTQLRTVSYLLHPPLLDQMGFCAAVRWYAEGFSKRSGIALDVHIPESLPRLADEKEMALFRIVQESLTNVHRHSGAREVTIRVTLTGNAVQLEIADRGKGIAKLDAATPEGGTAIFGVGIRGMRERLRELQGNLEIRPNNPGTRVVATIPLSESRATATASEIFCADAAQQPFPYTPARPAQ